MVAQTSAVDVVRGSVWIGKGIVGTPKQSELPLLGERDGGSIRFVGWEARSFRTVRRPEWKKARYISVR